MKRREKQEQRKTQYSIVNKQHEDRKIFLQQAKAETAVKYNTPKAMTSSNKVLQLKKERRGRGEEFSK